MISLTRDPDDERATDISQVECAFLDGEVLFRSVSDCQSQLVLVGIDSQGLLEREGALD